MYGLLVVVIYLLIKVYLDFTELTCSVCFPFTFGLGLY